MSLVYPEKTVWFVQCRNDLYGPRVQGSAVAIRLQKKGDSDTAQTYLLTCSHVIRKNAGIGEEFSEVLAWEPGTGLNQNTQAVLKPKLRPLAKDSAYTSKDDWVILEFVDKDRAVDQTVGPWKKEPQYPCTIYGYPGEKSFQRPGVVSPTPTRPFQLRDQDSHHVMLTGTETRPGMSGGGLFDGAMFAGIHRSRDDNSLKLHSISASSILNRLRELEYEPVDWRPKVLTDLTDILAAFLDDVFFTAYRRSLPRTHEWSHVSKESREDAIIRLMELKSGFNNERPIDSFVRSLLAESTDDDTKKKISDWLATFAVPISTNVSTKSKLTRRTVEEPRIVIRMQPANSDEIEEHARFPHSHEVREPEKSEDKTVYFYQIWFVGFAEAPHEPPFVDYRHTFPSVIRWAWDFVKPEHDPTKVWVELSVPRELIYEWAVEGEDVELDQFTKRLGRNHHFVLRSEDRTYPKLVGTRMDGAMKRSAAAKESIKLQCIKMQKPPVDPPDQNDYLITLDCQLSPDDVHSSLLRNKSVLGAYLHFSPNASEAGIRKKILNGVLESGVPLVMWLRNDAPADQNEISDRLHRKEWDKIPPELQGIRLDSSVAAAEDEWSLGSELAVILDTPMRDMPDVRLFSSPH